MTDMSVVANFVKEPQHRKWHRQSGRIVENEVLRCPVIVFRCSHEAWLDKALFATFVPIKDRCKNCERAGRRMGK